MISISVLVVDDDVDIANNTTGILSEFGYKVDVAYNGASALELVGQNSYDIALLNFKMPDIDGPTLCEKIKIIQPKIVTTMVTDFAGDEGIDRVKETGAWRVMTKPVDISKLLQPIEEAAGQPLVLVIDEETEFCDDLWDMLRKNGYRVGIAFSSEEACELLERHEYRVVLLEIQPARQSSASLFRSIRNFKKPPATLIVADYQVDGDPLVNVMLQQNAISVCYNPVEVAGFLEAIQQVVIVG